MEPKYKRVLIKLSGEALLGDRDFGIDQKVADRIADEIIEIQKMGVEVVVVIGAGNIFRGRSSNLPELDQVSAHNIGMLATVMNAISMRDVIAGRGGDVRVASAVFMPKICDLYCKDRAEHHLKKGRIVIIGGGTGNPYFSTDSAAALYSIELNCQIFLKATIVDGVYTADPVKDPSAKKYDQISHKQALVDELKVMDATALSLCMENNQKIIVCNLLKESNLKKVMMGDKVGTEVS
jgi:uridylate kinase